MDLCPVTVTTTVSLNCLDLSGTSMDGDGECQLTVTSLDVPGIGAGILMTVPPTSITDGGEPTFVWDSTLQAPQTNKSFIINGHYGFETFTAVGFYHTVCGTVYSTASSGKTSNICVAEGTLIRLASGDLVPVERIGYDDDLLVWDFDKGEFASAKPAWIKVTELTDRYNLLRFSNGSELRTILQHRIFNQQAGRFTPCMDDETPLGTRTLTSTGEMATLVSKTVVHEPVRYYNLITEGHFNAFAGDVLTSCRLNNLRPIENLKFTGEARQYHDAGALKGLDPYLVRTLRLAEQPLPAEEIQWYVRRLQRFALPRQATSRRAYG